MLPATPISSATVSTSRALRLLYLHIEEEGGRRCSDQSQGLTRARAMAHKKRFTLYHQPSTGAPTNRPTEKREMANPSCDLSPPT